MTAATDELRYGQFGLRTECPRCGSHLPVNGPVDAADCADCGERIKVPDELLNDLFDAFEDAWPKPNAASVTLGDLTWRWTAETVEAPGCPACKHALDAAEVHGDALLRCGGCEAAIPTHPVRKRLRRKAQAMQVIGGEADLKREAAPPKPVAMQCPQCGAGLTITGDRRRVSACDHCGVSVHLPDAIWRMLHPPRKVEAWTVRFEGESRRARTERIERERGEKKRAERDQRSRHEHDKARRRTEQEDAERVRKREADARRIAEAAEKRAREDADERRRAWIGGLLVVISMIASVGAVAFMGSAAALFSFVAPWELEQAGVPAHLTVPLRNGLVVGAAGVGFANWFFATIAVRVRWGESLVRGLPSEALVLGICLFPALGPVVAAIVWFLRMGAGGARGKPRYALLPLLPAIVGVSLYANVVYALIFETTVSDLVWTVIETLPED